MDITVKVIPEDEMRPEVNGADWYFDDNGDLQVRVSPMSDQRYEILLAVHEVIEGLLCRYDSVSQKSVDDFDLEYDKTHTFDTDAGDEPGCPYGKQHCVATAVERILCAAMEVCFSEYDKELRESYPGPSKKVKA